MQTKPFFQLTSSVQRMLLASLYGKPARLELANGTELFIEVQQLATIESQSFHSALVYSDYYTGEWHVSQLSSIKDIQPANYPITDPRHPEYEKQQTVVKPLPKPRRNP